jgi:hypothetical protein
MQRSGVLVVAALLTLSLVAMVPIPVSAHINDVSADAQVSPDGVVVAESVFIAKDGWLAVFADANHTEVLGYRRIESNGFQKDVPVAIDEDHWAEFDAATVHVALLNDDNGQFEPNGRDSVLTTFGRQASTAVPLRKGSKAVVTEEAFAPDWVNESTLTLRSVTLPETGHVVVRNASTGDVLGSTALEAGRHESVNVSLDAAAAFDGNGNYRLRATLHGDDGDGEFTSSDPAVTANGTAVATRFRVRRSAAATGTPTGTAAGDSTVQPTTSTGAESATASGTPTATESFVNTPTDSPTPTAEPGGSTASAPASGTDTAGDGAGFGVLAGVGGLLAAALFAARRRVGGER